MTRLAACGGIRLALLLLLAAAPSGASGQTYWPGRNLDWERRPPEELGLDSAKIRQAVERAIAGESSQPRDLALNHQMTFGREPYGEPIGPFTVRGAQTGLIVHKGYIVAEWGEPDKVDNTFSVAKSFLSATAGLAYDRGLIEDVHDLVRPYVAPLVLEDGDGEPGHESGRRPKLLFESEHNRRITWDHLLRQTSDWEGTLWGKPEWADRPDRDPSTWGTRARVGAGTAFEYNDVRVNLLALAAMSVWRQPLPEVLREYLMDPIGASATWRWHGYDNSWITLDGRQVQSVSGGSHWGGGMLISAFDLARFGLLTLHKGVWDGQRLLSEEWLAMAITPTDVQQGYGFMNFYLNTGRRQHPSAPESAWTHSGAGPNEIYVDPVNDLVIVSRWGAGMRELVGTVLDAMGVAGPVGLRAESSPSSPAVEVDPDMPSFTPFTSRPMLLNSDEVARTLDLEYTAELAAAGAGAAPVMWLHIGADGTTLRTQLAESSGVEELDRAAASVASVMRFSPAYNRERPVAVWIQMPIRFEVPN